MTPTTCVFTAMPPPSSAAQCWNIPPLSAQQPCSCKSLTEDHIPGDPPDSQMLPCCGHSLIPNDDLSEVYICGCPNGIDWTVRHEGKHVRLVLENGQETLVPLDAYKAEVFRFADQIQSFYDACAPKILPEKADDPDRLGYTVFWNEWHRGK